MPVELSTVAKFDKDNRIRTLRGEADEQYKLESE